MCKCIVKWLFRCMARTSIILSIFIVYASFTQPNILYNIVIRSNSLVFVCLNSRLMCSRHYVRSHLNLIFWTNNNNNLMLKRMIKNKTTEPLSFFDDSFKMYFLYMQYYICDYETIYTHVCQGKYLYTIPSWSIKECIHW